QVSDTGSDDPQLAGRIALLRQRAGASFTSQILGGNVTECDLIVKGVVGGERRGWLWDPGNGYLGDRSSDPVLSQAQLDAIADGGEALTYTCAPPGSGVRMALDEDLDGFLDGDERDARTEVANAGSAPGACGDGIDNDGDGAIDDADEGCVPGSNIENPACSNGIDDDLDGLVDAADDICTQPYLDSESEAPTCGLGAELALILPLLAGLRKARRRRLAAA
ncbi:MAG: hypothetical protein R3263_06555, partial [Myxococcota bacterium]|nr:hypothetical protein [Myxococcota bacterium]